MTFELERHQAEDDEARRVISEALDATLLVEAGAGTGKTRALVDRYVALIRAGHAVDELVAVTFTERAAAELRDRVRAELERVGDGDPLVQRALEGLDRAQISTIHSFALHLLRPLAAEFGINPSFEVRDEVAAERRFQERWHVFLETAGAEPRARAVVSRTLSLGLTTRDLERLARELWSNSAVAELLHSEPVLAQPSEQPDVELLKARLVDLGLDRVPADDRLRVSLEELLHALDEVRSTPHDEREALLTAMAGKLGVSSYGRAGAWGSRERLEEARAIGREVCATLSAYVAATRSEALAHLVPLFTGFVVTDVRARLRDGDLVFDDLILRLRDLLRESLTARDSLRRRYKTFLIDEFQDTDPLQVDIALAFARDPASGDLEPGRLFLVGDPKQSIYRFRRADMAMYADIRSSVEAARGQLPQLALNRRSRREILDAVNQLFATVIGSGERPMLQPPYRAVHAVRDEKLDGPGVAWFGQALDGAAREVRTREAAQVAAVCRAALADGWQVSETEGPRLARYRDIAILVPSRQILQPLERALAAAGVPYRVEGGSLIYATQEVRDLINCLTAIDDPNDDIAVVAALRSPLFACSDVELAEHRLAGGGFNYLAPGLAERPGRVPLALVDLRAMHDMRTRGLAPLVEHLVAEHRGVEAGLFDAANRNAFRRARFVIEQARAFEAVQPETLRAFIEWLERRAREAILDHEGAGLDDDEDAVRVLTIHASKGLEFPIVLLAGLGVAPANQPSVLSMDRASSAIAITIGAKTRGANFTLGPVDALAAQENEHQAAERDRLLYVATTRARDHLVVSLYHGQRARLTHAQRLIGAGLQQLAVELVELPEVTDARRAPFDGLTVEPSDVDDDGFLEARTELVRSARRRWTTSATALGRLAEPEPEEAEHERTDAERERNDDSEPWARGRAGTHRGRAVHAALQVLPWSADAEILDALARAQAVAEAVPDEAERIAELLRRALGTDAARRARGARRAQREVPFAVVDGDVTLEGFIDLVIETDDGIEVVDWKTDSIPATAVEERLESYRLQAGLYVLGLEAATRRPVRRVTYVFVSPGVEASPGQPEELAASARATLRSLTARTS